MAERFIVDERMYLLMEWAIENGLVKHQSHFLEEIGLTRAMESRIKKDGLSFHPKYVHAALQLTGVSADWLYGFSEKMHRKQSKSVVAQLQAVIMELKAQEKQKKMKKK